MRRRGGQKAERSEERERFVLLSLCFMFYYVVVSLSLSFVVVVVRISRSGVRLRLTYSISARSRGFYGAKKQHSLCEEEHTKHTHTCVRTTRVHKFSSGAFSIASDV